MGRIQLSPIGVVVDGRQDPPLDIKPMMKEFLPRTDLRQPGWSREL